jgi:hypothetical protein
MEETNFMKTFSKLNLRKKHELIKQYYTNKLFRNKLKANHFNS